MKLVSIIFIPSRFLSSKKIAKGERRWNNKTEKEISLSQFGMWKDKVEDTVKF